ncbi:hypothetical protein QOZ80_2BG0187970 [Eleusine coracana subsp. coracana]|nr:hypothetical protein QOZ80_2BG0187970 [Eleusine coracana subsp. coracana]
MDLTTLLLSPMATRDDEDDFGLLGDDDADHTPPETKPTPFHLPQLQGLSIPRKLHISPGFAAAGNLSIDARDDTVDTKSQQAAATKRGGGVKEEVPSDVDEYFSDFKFNSGASEDCKKGRDRGVASSSGAEFLANKEVWSEDAIRTLLDAYIERWEQLERDWRNLRLRDWEAMAAAVNKQHPAQDGGGGKSLDQCKYKIYSLKNRYEVECRKIACGVNASSKWPWFKKMEFISSTARSVAPRKPAYSRSDEKPRLQQRQNESCTPSSAGLVSVGVGSGLAPPLNPRWKRAVLKIGGSLLAGTSSENVDPKIIMLIAREVQVASLHGVQVAIVVGSRNIYCGDSWAAATGIGRAATYPIGMMASVMNAILLQASFEKIGIETRVQTSLTMQDATEPYTRARAICHLEKGRVVIFGGIGTSMGNPLFTTDTTAALRASEINAGVLLKGITGDSLSDCAPGSNGNEAFEHISYKELEARGASKIDVTAITLCEENNIPVVLFNMLEPGNMSRALCGDKNLSKSLTGFTLFASLT